MSGFRKAKAEQAAVKMSIYGPPGSGKTLSALLFAEGLAKLSGKRTAFVDTENGTAFYSMAVAGREVHPEAFDFDALYTRSLTEVLKECRALKPAEHGVVIIDSISHLWEAAMNAYSGPRTHAGTIPMHAWGKIKAPYKDLMKFLIDSPYHVFILGRQGNVFEEDAETGETKAAGFKMRAEGETAYEPHICLRMAPQRTHKTGRKVVINREQVIAALAEKDRTGILAGRLIEWPCFDNVIKPILGLMGSVQAATPSDEDAATQDADALRKQEHDRAQHSRQHREEFEAKFKLARSKEEFEAVSKSITPAIKKTMLPADVSALREACQAGMARFQGLHYEPVPVGANGREPGEEG